MKIIQRIAAAALAAVMITNSSAATLGGLSTPDTAGLGASLPEELQKLTPGLTPRSMQGLNLNPVVRVEPEVHKLCRLVLERRLLQLFGEWLNKLSQTDLPGTYATYARCIAAQAGGDEDL
jgi:hypothetical protein